MHPRTHSPSLHSCPASDRASSFLPASALLFPPPSLATRRWARRKMRPTDFCHPYVLLACTRTSSVPGSLRRFRDVGAPRILGSARLDRGIRRFTSPNPLWRAELRHSFGASRSFRYRRGIASVGVVFPRCRFDRASDIPVASPSSHPCSRPFERARFHAVDSPPRWRERRLRMDQARRKPPRLP
jgi:hypothetical protein